MAFPILTGEPESIFAVSDITARPPSMTARMRTGRSAHDCQGEVRPGALGVLADNALGYAVITGAPDGYWAVTTEMSIDFVGAMPRHSADVCAEASLLDSDDSSGYSEGTIVDNTGRVIARMRQRGRFVRGLPNRPERPSPDRNRGSDSLDLDALLGIRAVPHELSTVLTADVGTALVNPLGNLHGGVALYLAERVGNAELRRAGGPRLETASIQVAYVRPAPLGTTLRITAETMHRGRTFGLSRVVSALPDGRSCTIATVVGYSA